MPGSAFFTASLAFLCALLSHRHESAENDSLDLSTEAISSMMVVHYHSTGVSPYCLPLHFLLLVLFTTPVISAYYLKQDVLVLATVPDTRAAKRYWTDPPSSDDSSNLIFSSISGFLKHWQNALYRNGHTIVPGVVTTGTLLYHGTTNNCTGLPPKEFDWVSFDPEHSYGFSSRIYTFQVVRPLKVLYFDGSSAANMPTGTIDTQEILSHGELRDGEWRREFTRIKEMCQWGQRFGLDGFIRMEFDFEIEICDFTAGLEVVSFLDLLPTYRGIPRPGCPDDVTPSQDTSASSSAIEDPPSLLNATPGDAEQRGDSRFLSQLHSPFIPPKHLPPHPPDIPPPEGWVGSLRPWSSAVFDVIEAGNRHNMPGLMSSVALDYTRLVTFFDSKYKSLVKARRKQKRATYRVGNLTREEAGQARLEVEGMLVTWNPSNERTMGRVRWDAVVRTVIERYATRLEYLSVLLVEGASGRNKGNYSEDRKMNATKSAQRARWQVLTMLTPYMPAATQPRRDQPTDPDWLALTINHCAESSSAHIRSGTLTAPEKLIKGAVEAVTHEICRTMGVVWLDAFDVESKSEVEQEARMVKWLQELMRLKEWLGWTEWSDYVECEPRCSPHEMCTQPQWPLDIDWDGRGGEDLNQPYCMSKWWGAGV